MAHHPCATVSFEDDEWHVVTDKNVHSRHDTKKDAIATAKDVDGINTVMAFTKGNSNINTIKC